MENEKIRQMEVDAKNFSQVVEKYFEERQISEYEFLYKIKFPGFFHKEGISLDWWSFDKPLENAYKEVLDKWYWELETFDDILREKLAEKSIKLWEKEAGIIGSMIIAKFTMQK